MKKQDVFKFSLVVLLVLAIYVPVFIWMVQRWTAAETYYSHGFLVPVISLFLIWRRRKELRTIKITPSNAGWSFFIAGILVYVISALWQVYFSAGFSLLFVLTGLVLLLLGTRLLKIIIFPLLFLGFMIPLPLLAISNLSFRLKIFASQLAVFVVKSMGMSVVREGSMIKTAHSFLMVEDPCSGIRSLIALIALGTLMAYLTHLSRTKKIILFLSSIPIAILSNVIRIIVLTLASEMYGSQMATGKFHDIMGIVVFIIAFIGLLIVRKILE